MLYQNIFQTYFVIFVALMYDTDTELVIFIQISKDIGLHRIKQDFGQG